MQHDNKLVKHGPDRSVSVAEEGTHVDITVGLVGMFEVLNTFGKKWTPAIAQGWLLALALAPDVTLGEFQGACAWWMAKESAFPCPAQVIGWIRTNRDDKELMERIKTSIAAQDAERAREREAWSLERFGTTDPNIDQLREYMWQVFDQEPKRIPSARPHRDIDPEKLKAVEAELNSRTKS